MGFDLYAENGGYFQNNIWGWRPLWYYVAKTCHDILTIEDIDNGYCNEGHWISASKAKKIACRLRELLDFGHTADYAKKYYKYSSHIINKDRRIPDDAVDPVKFFEQMLLAFYSSGHTAESGGVFAVDNVKNFIEFCEASGGFSIW